jgi:hypothetical protein
MGPKDSQQSDNSFCPLARVEKMLHKGLIFILPHDPSSLRGNMGNPPLNLTLSVYLTPFPHCTCTDFSSFVRLIVIHLPFFTTFPSQVFSSLPSHYPFPTLFVSPVFLWHPFHLSIISSLISPYRSIGAFGFPCWWQKFALYFLSLLVTWYLNRPNLVD